MAGANGNAATAAGSDGLSPGPPGAVWTNWTSWTWYQWVSDLIRPCATCLRRHGRLFPQLPTRPHDHCRCEFLPVPPNARAPIAGRTPARTLAAIPESGRESLLGKDTMRLLGAGLVRLEDVAGTEETGWLLLAFTELVRRRKLTFGQLVRAGVDEATARRATGGEAR